LGALALPLDQSPVTVDQDQSPGAEVDAVDLPGIQQFVNSASSDAAQSPEFGNGCCYTIVGRVHIRSAPMEDYGHAVYTKFSAKCLIWFVERM
jgi:hypothetical protein